MSIRSKLSPSVVQHPKGIGSLFWLGVKGDPYSLDNRRTVLVNQLTWFYLLLTVMPVSIDLIQHTSFTTTYWVFVGFWLQLGAVLWLNYTGRLRTARYTYTCSILIYFYVLNVMRPAEVPLFKATVCAFQLGALASALIILDLKRDRWAIVASIVLVFLQIIFFFELDPLIDYFDTPYSEEDLKARAVMMIAVTMFTFVFSLLFYQRVSRKAEDRITQLLDDARLQNTELMALQDELQRVAEKLQATNQQLASALDTEARSRHELAQTHSELHRLSEFKDLLTGTVAHDLKNPLNAILALADAPPDPDRLRSIRQAGQQMLTLVLNLLDVQRYEQAHIRLNRQPVHLSTAVGTAWGQVSYWAQSRSITLESTIEPGLCVEADAVLIERVLVNLLTNALKHAPAGDRLLLVARSDAKRGAVVELTDHGPGIDADRLDRVFDKYHHSSTGRGQQPSTGLGLTFCRLAIEAHGGHIEARSVPGQQTTFAFNLPTRMESLQLPGEPVAPATSRTALPVDHPAFASACGRLRQLPVYDISRILDVLESLPEGPQAWIAWKQAVERAALAAHEDEYLALLA